MTIHRTLCALVLLACPALASADNWPTWRGPDGLGVSKEKGLPVTWSTTENVRWKVALPAAGNSTPIIWGDKVFITQASDLKQWPPKVPDNYAGGASAGGHAIAEKRSVTCFRKSDGKLLWQGDTIYKKAEITHPTNPFCSASPVTDGERVIASHGSAGLVCYDLDGKQLWKYDVGEIEHLWGTASSPILYGDLCIQWCGPGKRQFLLAVDKKTGKKVWETPEVGGDPGITSKKFLGSWCTPIIARVGGKDQLIFAVPGRLAGFDPKTGKELWSGKGMAGVYCYSSPLFVDGLAIYGSGLVKLGGSGDLTKDRLKYRVGSMYISTAVIHGDHLYTLNDVGVPACYEWKTGDELWKDQITKRPGGVAAWGSLVYADGRIYVTDQRGSTLVFAAGPKYQHLATNRLNEHTNASLAVSGGDLFIRTHKHLWCIGEKKEEKKEKEAKKEAKEPALKVHLIGVGEYEPHKSLPKFQKYLEKTYRVECTASLGTNTRKLDNLDALGSADVLVLFARRLNLPEEQMKVIRAHWEKGKPIVAMRTSSHAFQPDDNKVLDKEVLGGDYKGSGDYKKPFDAIAAKDQEKHPVLAGVKPITSRGYYNNGTLAKDTVVLQVVKSDRKVPLPVTWTHTYKGGRMLYTSMGVPEDFKDENFLRLLSNAVLWTAKRDPEQTKK